MLFELKLLVLILVANGAPIIVRNLLRDRLSQPVDFKLTFFDGRAIFGANKTFRGLGAALLLTPVAAKFLDIPVDIAVLIAILAMSGDLLSSFIKRRFAISPGGMAPGLDQIPESLLPMLACQAIYDIGPLHVAGTVILFIVLELALSRFLYQLNIRRHKH